MDKKLKVGDKLYGLVYYNKDFIGLKKLREVRTYTIKKINKNTIEMRGYSWKIKISEIGYIYFTSKKEMYKDGLEQHEEELFDLMCYKIKPLQKEIKYLKKKIEEL